MFYRGEIADAIVKKVQANGGVMTRERPRGVRAGMGRADLDELSRLRRVPAAAAGTGLRRARDAEHPRGLRAEARASTWRRSVPPIRRYWHLLVEAKKLAYADLLAKNADPKFATGPGQGAALEVVRGDAVRSDQPGPRVDAGRARRHRRRDDLPDHRRSLGQHGVAHPQRVQRVRQPRDGRAVRLRAAQPRRRLLARPRAARTSSRRASGRSTRSSPAS